MVWWAGRRRLPWVIGIVIAMSIATRMAISGMIGNPFLQFTTLLSCSDGLAMGAALSLWYRHDSARKMASPFLVLTVALLAAAMTVVGYHALWSPTEWATGPLGDWIFSIVCLFYTSLLWLVVSSRGAQRILEWAPLRQLGKISYGLYLYHGLIFIIVDKLIHYHTAPHTVTLCLLRAITVLVATVVVAHFSYTFFEGPILRLKGALANGQRQSATDTGAA